ncbi:putative carbohydrate esterase At4g34215 [Apium graveolens]|uniref:putative carbohydrate esterase At4g34215 n=1 Tax=Apium graveolens TaxID=4045 RepID=UPI003D7BA15C
MLAFCWLMLLVYASLVGCEKHIILLAGQSNMSGRGGVVNDTWDGIVPDESRPSRFIIQLTAGLTWEKAEEPLHRDIDITKVCGIGPGLAFAKSLLHKDSSVSQVALVPCAIGGTNISQWARGSQLYNQLVRRAVAAVQGGGTIRAMLWYQGESDTETLADAELYKGRFENFIINLRQDLVFPMLPVIQVALASGSGPFIAKVREAQLGTELPNVWCVDAKGLQLQPDGLHLSSAAQVQLGKMLAHAFLQTIPSPIHSSAARGLPKFNGLSLFQSIVSR